MLGVVIGVAAVIAVVGFGEGHRRRIEEEIEKAGADIFWVSPKFREYFSSESQARWFEPSSLTVEDMDAIQKRCRKVKAVAPTVNFTEIGSVLGHRSTFDLVGTYPALQRIRKLDLLRGRFITPSDLKNNRRVCIIELSKTASRLFRGSDPLQREIRVRGQNYKVIGVVRPETREFGGPSSVTAYLPLTSLQRLVGRTTIGMTYALTVDSKFTEGAMREVETLLRSRRLGRDQFRVSNISRVMESAKRLTRTATLVTSCLAVVSLLVGGIGIMNIMLVSVTERTREIGIRKAAGARRRDIRRQFLLEATTLSMIGGSLGILIGVQLAKIIAPVINLPVAIPFWSIGIGGLFSVGTGIISGFYPAYRPANFSPIQALRYG
ncbi:MAG: ABC transporter permease [bacterium]